MEEQTKQKQTTYAQQLASYIVSFNLESTPSQVVTHARYLFLDLLGAALAGLDTPEAQAALRAVSFMAPSGGPCTLWGTEKSSTPNGAALFNGIIAHARELDDFGGADHSGAVIIPALLAVVDSNPTISGKTLLESIIVGYEVARRVLDSAGGYRPHNHSDGFHSTGTCGSFGAAAAVSKALGLSEKETTWALGLTGSYTGGTWAFSEDGAMSKRFNVGRAAETGLTAAFLAKSGFTGPAHIFESEWGGFLGTYAREDIHPEALVNALGTSYGIMRSGIKPYAACRDIHSTLDVIFEAKKAHGLTTQNIAKIEVKLIPEMAQMVGRKDLPTTRFEAQLNLRYSVGIALTCERAFIAEYEEPYLNMAEVKQGAELVELIASPELPFDSEPYITITTKDGQTIKGHVDYASGAPQNPLQADAIIDKFTSLATRVFTIDKCSQLREKVLSIDNAEDVQVITSLLTM
ncbi:MAG: 2-methylcitrate dehydratase [Desulfotalea sp.]|nr:MAG: 2-methylcitrate dehydratase [Desulfotalea sp.]